MINFIQIFIDIDLFTSKTPASFHEFQFGTIELHLEYCSLLLALTFTSLSSLH